MFKKTDAVDTFQSLPAQSMLNGLVSCVVL